MRFPIALVALVVPLAWSVGDARELTRTDTRIRANAWVAAHVPRGDRIAADPSTLPLLGRDVVRLELPGPGAAFDPDAISTLSAPGAWMGDHLGRGHRPGARGAATAIRARSRSTTPSSEGEPAPTRISPASPGLAGPWVRVYRL